MINFVSFDEDNSIVYLESDATDAAEAIQELRSPRAKKMAIKEVAKLGIRNAGVSGFIRVYAVDTRAPEEKKNDPVVSRKFNSDFRYRAAVRVASSINI